MPDNQRIDDLRRRVQKDPASIAFAQLAEECRRAGQYRGIDRGSAAPASTCIPAYLSARVTLGRALIEINSIGRAQIRARVRPQERAGKSRRHPAGSPKSTTAAPRCPKRSPSTARRSFSRATSDPSRPSPISHASSSRRNRRSGRGSLVRNRWSSSSLKHLPPPPAPCQRRPGRRCAGRIRPFRWRNHPGRKMHNRWRRALGRTELCLGCRTTVSLHATRICSRPSRP